MTPAGTPAIGYCRVSTEEQGDNGASLDAQEHELRSYAQARGWELSIRREVASGKSMRKRPVLREALTDLREGRAGVLMVTKLDRLARYAPDAILTVDSSSREGWLFVSTHEQFDTSTALGRGQLGMAAVFAQMLRDQGSEATKAGMAQRKREGVHCGRPNALNQTKRPEERERAERAIARMRALRAQGLSIRKIQAALNEEGIPTIRAGKAWSIKTTHQALRRYVD